MRTHNKEIKALANTYILNAIDSEAYNVTTTTDKEKLQFLADTFKSEYCYPANLNYYGSYQNTLCNWIQGLPSAFNIDFTHDAILELAIEWGSLKKNASDAEEGKILNNWFNWIACKTMQLFDKYNINYK